MVRCPVWPKEPGATLTQENAMFKDWKKICQVPDTHFMWALALLDTNTDFGRQVVERFPEYFTQEEETGPVPLSVLRMEAEENAARQGGTCGSDHLTTYDAIPSWMPTLYFAEGGPLNHYPEAKPVPSELKKIQDVGTVCEWEGKKLVLVEWLDDGQWWFVPAELIAVDR